MTNKNGVLIVTLVISLVICLQRIAPNEFTMSLAKVEFDGSARNRLRDMEHLVSVVLQLSNARSLETITSIVRTAVRELTGCDGATFVLREGDYCNYLDEDAITPLWKGKKFPMADCISGWVMLNKQAAFIEDIYSDPRIPIDAYKPTFVRSLAMVPIRQSSPVGAVGAYWANPHCSTADEIKLLQAVADTASVAMENVRCQCELEQRVAERTTELEAANKGLESFAYAVSHDLRAPLRSVKGFVEALNDECGSSIPPVCQDYLSRISKSANRMSSLIEDLLKLSQTSGLPVQRESVDLTLVAQDVMTELRSHAPGREVIFDAPKQLVAQADPHLIQTVFDNLLSNAWKFSAIKNPARIELGTEQTNHGLSYFVRDNGAGFDMKYVEKLFTPFQRLHSEEEFRGTGVGLATVCRIIQKHGGKIWAKGEPNKGATFYFTLGES